MIQRLKWKWRLWWGCWRVMHRVEMTVFRRTRDLMTLQDPVKQAGEWKRHQVYAQLLKEFPDVTPSHLALTIEVVKCGL